MSEPSPAKPLTILYAAADLLWATKIKSTGEAIGIHCRPVRSLDMLVARLADSRVVGLLLDIETGEAGEQLLAHLRGPAAGAELRAVAVVAFGPHVQVDALNRARAGGADAVLARGALHANLPGVLRQLAAAERVASRMED